MHREGYAPSSISRKLSAVRALLRFLELRHELPSNPLTLIKGPKQVKHLPSVLSVAEVETLLAQPDRSTPIGLRAPRTPGASWTQWCQGERASRDEAE